MANVKIAELPSAESIDVDNDFLVLDQTGGTKKATPVQVFDKKTITYETWQGYTDEQKQSFNGYVTNVPGANLTAAENCILSSGGNVDDAIENITSDLSELMNVCTQIGTKVVADGSKTYSILFKELIEANLSNIQKARGIYNPTNGTSYRLMNAANFGTNALFISFATIITTTSGLTFDSINYNKSTQTAIFVRQPLNGSATDMSAYAPSNGTQLYLCY